MPKEFLPPTCDADGRRSDIERLGHELAVVLRSNRTERGHALAKMVAYIVETEGGHIEVPQ